MYQYVDVWESENNFNSHLWRGSTLQHEFCISPLYRHHMWNDLLFARFQMACSRAHADAHAVNNGLYSMLLFSSEAITLAHVYWVCGGGEDLSLLISAIIIFIFFVYLLLMFAITSMSFTWKRFPCVCACARLRLHQLWTHTCGGFVYMQPHR